MTEVEWDRSSSADEQWMRKAVVMRVEGDLVVELRVHDKVRVLRATGLCPRCLHEVSYVMEQTAIIARGGRRANRLASNETGPYDVQCRCQRAHDGRPEAGRGCGLIFPVMDVEIR